MVEKETVAPGSTEPCGWECGEKRGREGEGEKEFVVYRGKERY